MKTESFLADVADIALQALELNRAGDKDAGLVLACGAESIGRKHRVSYSDAKQAIGFFLAQVKA